MSGDHNQYQKATGYAMNERIIKLEIKAKELARELVDQRKYDTYTEYQQSLNDHSYIKFAQLIVEECAKLNLDQSYNLMGVLADMAEPDAEFDRVCLNTVNHVHTYLSGNALKRYFGVEE